MTTIAYREGIIAYDTRLTKSGVIVDDAFNKRVERDGVIFILSGAPSGYDAFIESYMAGEGKVDPLVEGMVVDQARAWISATDNGTGWWRFRMDLSKYYTIGSGRDHALTAMDMGADARQAVRIAMRRDVATGGRVRTYRIAAYNEEA